MRPFIPSTYSMIWPRAGKRETAAGEEEGKRVGEMGEVWLIVRYSTFPVTEENPLLFLSSSVENWAAKYLCTQPQWTLTWLPSETGYINNILIRARGSQWGAVKVKGFCRSRRWGKEDKYHRAGVEQTKASFKYVHCALFLWKQPFTGCSTH